MCRRIEGGSIRLLPLAALVSESDSGEWRRESTARSSRSGAGGASISDLQPYVGVVLWGCRA